MLTFIQDGLSLARLRFDEDILVRLRFDEDKALQRNWILRGFDIEKFCVKGVQLHSGAHLMKPKWLKKMPPVI